jgi:hypothetical protein
MTATRKPRSKGAVFISISIIYRVYDNGASISVSALAKMVDIGLTSSAIDLF